MFKSYTSNDNLLLPPCLGDFIPQNDPVRVVHRIIEQINLEELYCKYSTKGCSAYHPRMMLQILVYAYLRNIIPAVASKSSVAMTYASCGLPAM